MNMKVGYNLDPCLNEIFECRILGNTKQTYRSIPLPNRDPITQVMESGSSFLGSHTETH